MKLKLLENRPALDAGLYVGFVGSVLALILMSIGIGKISVSLCFHLGLFSSLSCRFFVRPLRRQLIMDSEMESQAVKGKTWL
jgi:hypothetical protein